MYLIYIDPVLGCWHCGSGLCCVCVSNRLPPFSGLKWAGLGSVWVKQEDSLSDLKERERSKGLAYPLEDGGSMFLCNFSNTGHFQMVPTHKNSVNINNEPLWKPTT